MTLESYLYKKAGVMIAGIESASGRQVDWFAPYEKLMQTTLDVLNMIVEPIHADAVVTLRRRKMALVA